MICKCGATVKVAGDAAAITRFSAVRGIQFAPAGGSQGALWTGTGPGRP